MPSNIWEWNFNALEYWLSWPAWRGRGEPGGEQAVTQLTFFMARWLSTHVMACDLQWAVPHSDSRHNLPPKPTMEIYQPHRTALVNLGFDSQYLFSGIVGFGSFATHRSCRALAPLLQTSLQLFRCLSHSLGKDGSIESMIMLQLTFRHVLLSE